jgi:hypothetical protein
MTADIHILSTVTRLDIPAERVIENLPKDLENLVVIGVTESGEFYFASNTAAVSSVLWLLEIAKKRLLSYGDDY